jgi:SpoVK/Ycf46/Vps4 family AAA+-type ATPase
MGATNRPKDVDRAILRRMPSTFHIGLPSVQQRISILKRILVNSGIFYILSNLQLTNGLVVKLSLNDIGIVEEGQAGNGR